MASDVLQDLMRALCSLSIVEPTPRRSAANASASAVRNAAPSERRQAAASQEAA
jgi:hypothetical protein